MGCDSFERVAQWAADALRTDRINIVCEELSPKCQEVLQPRWQRGFGS